MITVGFVRIQSPMMYYIVSIIKRKPNSPYSIYTIIEDCNRVEAGQPTAYYINSLVISHFETIWLHIGCCMSKEL